MNKIAELTVERVAVEKFKDFLYERTVSLYRDMPWRDDTQPYYVLVSELMLQQTQVSRVIPKFNQFITAFPDEKALAFASLADVLRQWQGLGYNRRAKFLHEAAKRIMEVHGGTFPDTYNEIVELPGVGPNTAGAILAYAFNQPIVFVETNIRTVYIHHFFSNEKSVHDDDIKAMLKATLDYDSPREFYWALMDYGFWLKSSGVRTNARSKHYVKQAKLAGSMREMRGAIIRVLSHSELTKTELRHTLQADRRFDHALESLINEGLVTQKNHQLYLTK